MVGCEEVSAVGLVVLVVSREKRPAFVTTRMKAW